MSANKPGTMQSMSIYLRLKKGHDAPYSYFEIRNSLFDIRHSFFYQYFVPNGTSDYLNYYLFLLINNRT